NVRLWDVASGRQVRMLSWSGALWGLSIEPAGRWLAAGHSRGELLLWDLRRLKREPHRVRAHDGGVRDVAFGPDGSLLATSGTDGRVRLWEVPSWRLVRVLSGHRDVVTSLAFRPDGKWLATAGQDGAVRLWEVGSGRLVRTLTSEEGAASKINTVAFSPDGKLLSLGRHDGVIEVLDLESGARRTLTGHRGRIQWMAFHPDGRHLGTPSIDGTWRLWDLETGAYRAFEGHRSELNYLRFDATGQIAATSSDDGTVRLWDISSGRQHWRGTLLVRNGDRGVGALTHEGWNGPAGSAPGPGADVASDWRFAAAKAATGRVSPSGDLLCLHTNEDRLDLWDLAGDRQIGTWPVEGFSQILASDAGCMVLSAGDARLYRAAGQPVRLAEQALALGLAEDGEVLVAAGRLIHTFDREGTPVAKLDVPGAASAVAGLRSWYVLGYEDGTVEAVARSSGSKVVVPFEATASSAAVKIVEGPPGTVAVGFAAGELGLWEVATGLRLDSARLHGPVEQLLVDGTSLHALTALGDLLVRDLSAFHLSHCDLLVRARNRIPVVWENGSPVVPLARLHGPCAAGKGRSAAPIRDPADP
ncbi:MAG: WD40 repeat domain-containing protein, partial [bacterium]